MPIRPLPEFPSLEHLRKQAKRLLKGARAAESDPIALVREFHPGAEAALKKFKLSEAQLVVARSYGFASWTKLRHHLRSAEPRASAFLRLACLDYEHWEPPFAEKALRMLREHPELTRDDLCAAGAAGEVPAARAILARDPALARAKGGPHEWEPLLYVCYSRVGGDSLEVARLLLAAGADPNAGFLWHGNLPPFTALTGAFGQGEDGNNQPPHAHALELARLLLEAGADPNDGQTLYNRHFRHEDDHLKLLLSFGLGRDKKGPWYARFGDRMQSPARLLVEELCAAARKSYRARVELLVEHGVDLNVPGVRDGRTPYESALLVGHDEIAESLAAHGARRIELDPTEAFATACIRGDRAQARAFLAKDPTLLDRLGRHGRVVLTHRAVEANRPDGLRLMAELGFEMSAATKHDGVALNLEASPMHNAAWGGHVELVKTLLELGADPLARDPNYHATPLGWARHNHQERVVELLLPYATIVEATELGAVERVDALLAENASLAQSTPLALSLRSDSKRLEEMLALFRARGVDLNPTLDRAIAEGDDAFAAALRDHGARRANV